MRLLLSDLRQRAIAASLFNPGTLGQAIERLGFVKVDPIRAPAPARDLILRHRVKDHRVGDVEQHYRRLGLEEGRLHAHGFMSRSTWRLLHPRLERRRTALEKRVLDIAATTERIHPGRPHCSSRPQDSGQWMGRPIGWRPK